MIRPGSVCLPGAAGIGSQLPPASWDQHHRMRAIAVADVAKQREGDREQDALFDANAHDSDSGDGGEGELAGAFTADLAQAGDVDHGQRRR